MASPDWRDERINRKLEIVQQTSDSSGITMMIANNTTYLADMLKDIENETGRTGLPRELHMRLNESEKPWPLPIFVGWYEAAGADDRRMQFNQPHPALLADWR